MEKEKKFSFKNVKIPHTYVIIFSLIIIAVLLTHVIPSGEYDRAENEAGVTVINPTSYHSVENSPAGFFDAFSAVPEGMEGSAALIFFVFIVGGSFQIITGTGAVDMGINKIAKSVKGRENLLIPIFVFIFSLGGGFMGMSNESLIFIPIGISLARKLGFDALVGTAMIAVGMAGGFAAGIMNPFNVGIAQSIAELPMFSGVLYRAIIHITFVVILSVYLVRYSNKIKKDPSKSIVYELEIQEKSEENTDVEIEAEVTSRHILVLLTVLIGFIYMIYGVFKYEWGTDMMATIFLAMGVVGGLLGGLKPGQVAKEFITGAKSMVFGALVIGLARGILVVLQNGLILDTIVNGMSALLRKCPSQFTVILMYIMNIFLNLVIPSGSGQAAATMPLMVPVADLTGVTRQIAVLTFALGDGIGNSINPTSSNMNSYLSLAKITYPQWIRFIGPVIGIWFIVGGIFIVAGNLIGYGPF